MQPVSMTMSLTNVFAIMARTKSLAFLLKMYVLNSKRRNGHFIHWECFLTLSSEKTCLLSKSCQRLILRLLFMWSRILLPKNCHQQFFSYLFFIWHAFRTHVFTKNNLLFIWLLRGNVCHSESSFVGLYITKPSKLAPITFSQSQVLASAA